MPDCPIAANDYNRQFTATLPASSPIPLKLGFKGVATLTDASGALVAQITLNGDVAPHAAAPVELSALAR